MLFPFPSRSRWNKAAEMANAAANPELLSEKIDERDRRKFLDLEKSPFSRNGEIKSLILLAASYYELLLWKPVFKELVFTKLVCCCLVFTEPETMRLICSKSAILSTSFLLISFELFSFNRLVF